MGTSHRVEFRARALCGAAVLIGAQLLAGGCAKQQKQKLVEDVAKDWCMTIRASQVIPLYPLTEDVQPGDVFLVQNTVEEQQKVYKQKGFLPLDYHLARLDPSGYHEFYDRSFDPRKESLLPGTWQLASGSGSAWAPAPRAAFPTYSFSVSSGAGLNLAVPVSGIPVGLSLLGSDSANGSISIDKARTMGVDILSAYTDLQAWAAANQEFLKHYAPDSSRAAKGTKAARKTNYLRMVTRIYSTGKLDVALSDAGSRSGGADFGAPRPVDLVAARPPADRRGVEQATIDSYRNNLTALNAMLAESYNPTRPSGTEPSVATPAEKKAAAEAAAAERKRLEAELRKQQEAVAKARAALKDAGEDAARKAAAQKELETAQTGLRSARDAVSALTDILPGGSLRVTAASSRYVALQQDFDPPLIIGYLAFDVAIKEGGKIGAPIPTYALLEPRSASDPRPESMEVVDALYPQNLPNDEYEYLEDARRDGNVDAARALDQLDALGASFVPVNEGFNRYEATNDGLAEKDAGLTADYGGFKRYVALLQGGPLARALAARRPLKLTRANGQQEEVAVDSEAWKSLEQVAARRAEQLAVIQNSPKHRAAVREAGAVYVQLKIANNRRGN